MRFRVRPFVLSLQYIICATPQHCASARNVLSSTSSALSTRLISSRGSSKTGSIGICRPDRHGSWNATRIFFADSVQLVVELERPVALRTRRDERLHAEHLDDLRVIVAHPLEDVDLALPQLVVAAALHERPVEDHRLDPDRPE